MMTARNGFGTRAVAIDIDGNVFATGEHTWHDDVSQSVTGVVAGRMAVVNGETECYPADKLTTKREVELFHLLCAKMKAIPVYAGKNTLEV